MISTVPRPSPLRRTIRARHVFLPAIPVRNDRFETSTVGGTHIDDDGRLRQTRTQHARRESLAGFKRQILSTSSVLLAA